MRIKNFTLMLLVLLMSAASFAQKSFSVQKSMAFNRQAMVKTLTAQTRILPALAASQKTFPTRVAAKAPANAEVVTPPAEGEMEYFTLTGTAVYGQTVENVTRTVKVVWDGDDVYISGLSYYIPDAFVKGTFTSDNEVLFEKGQFLGTVYNIDLYFGAYGDGVLDDAVASFDGNTNTFTFSDILLDNADASELGYYAYWNRDVVIAPIDENVEMPVEIPNDLEIVKYAYTAYDYFSENAEVSGNLNIGIYGNDVYVQGMSTDEPDAWIKGTFENDTTVLFASGQMLADDLYFIAVNDNFDIVDSYTLIYDPKTGIFTEGPEAPMINAYKDEINASVYQFYYGYEIKKITEKAATPAKSSITAMSYAPGEDVLEFVLAKVDVDGDGLVADKLAYKLFYEGTDGNPVAITFSKDLYQGLTEDLTEIPASFADGKGEIADGAIVLKMNERTSWKKIGVQGIYYGGDQRNESEIAWYTITWPQTITLPEGLTVTTHLFKGETYDRDGNVEFERTVGLALSGDTMYIRGLGDANEDAWVKGYKTADDTYTFPKGQDLGTYARTYRLFLVGYPDGEATDVVLKVDATNGVYQFEGAFLENAKYTDKSYYLNRFETGAISIAEYVPEKPQPVVVPDNLETETFTFSAVDYFDAVDVARNIQVGVVGNDVYVQGVSEYLPEAWIKGTTEGDKVTFATGQFLGEYKGTELWFIGYDTSIRSITDYVMDFDAATSTLTCTSLLAGVNAYQNKVQASVYEFYQNVKVQKIVEKATTPATPSVNNVWFAVEGEYAEFSIPTVDVEGAGLVSDKVFYKFYYEDAEGTTGAVTLTKAQYETLENDMTEIPLDFYSPDSAMVTPGSLFLAMKHDNWKRVGIQTIYTGGGESNASEIGWYTITWPQTISLPEALTPVACQFKGSYYSSTGNVDFDRVVKIATDGNDLYIQGLGRVDGEVWIKGTKGENDDTYVFAKGQDMGINTPKSGDPYRLFLLGYNSTLGVMDAKIRFNAETNTYTLLTEFVENADYTDKLYWLTRINAGATISAIPDAIKAIDAEAELSGIIYNMAGQRVSKNYKGIVVKNGKKVVLM